MSKMQLAEPHFVRCIKPNMQKTASKFDVDFVRAQLRYTGVMETVRIRQQGYAMRLTAREFLDRYVVELGDCCPVSYRIYSMAQLLSLHLA